MSSSDAIYPRITFHAPGKTFDRLLKESSLSSLKDAVRKKLGLDAGSMIQFTQLRHEQIIDLEDEDDFDAFYAVVREQHHASVQVVLSEKSIANDSKDGNSPVPGSIMPPLPPTPVSALPAAPRKKVVLRNEDAIEINMEALTTKASPIPLTMSMATRNLPPTSLRKTGLIRIETPEQRQKRLQEEEQKEAAANDNAEERGKRREEKRKENKKQEQEIKVQTLTVDDIAETDRENKEILGELHPSKEDNEEWSREALEINMSPLKQKRHEHLNSQNSKLPPSRLTSVMPIKDLNTITYPEGINDIKPELNIGSRGGKFRYDRDFLLQFMSVCKERPAFLFPLDAFGLEPVHPLSSIHVPGKFSGSMSSANIPLPPFQKTENRSVELIPSHRTRSKRGGGSKASNTSANSLEAQSPDLGFIASFPATGNGWDRKPITNNDPNSPEVIDSEVRILLDKLVVEDFDTTSNEIIRWANRSENCKDGRILVQITRLVFEKAIEDYTWSGIYARLCKKMKEHISSKVQDEGVKNFEGGLITGGQLFFKYLLNRCHEDFERGWFAKGATTTPADKMSVSSEGVTSDECSAAQNARRQGLGLIKFIGELFKRQMLTERIMHDCIKKLLGNAENRLEEDIEGLCMLLTTVGSLLDTRKARAHLDVYFQRMLELTKDVSPQMQNILQDVIELRGRHWHPRIAPATPTTIVQAYEAAVNGQVHTEKEAMHHLGVSSGDSQADGWNSVPRATARAGDLSQFGRINKAQSPTMFGPGSVFAGKKDFKHEPTSRMNSSSNMFSALQVQQEPSDEQLPRRKKRLLQSRTKPVEVPRPPEESTTSSSEGASAVSALTEEAARARISEVIEEFFSIRNLDEAEIYFTSLPSQYHHQLVNKLVSRAVESKEPDATLVADLFRRVNSKGLCSSDALEEGLTPTADIIEDIAIDAPKAWSLFATMVKGAQFDEDHRTRLAPTAADSDKLIGLLSDVIGLREHKWRARTSNARVPKVRIVAMKAKGRERSSRNMPGCLVAVLGKEEFRDDCSQDGQSIPGILEAIAALDRPP